MFGAIFERLTFVLILLILLSIGAWLALALTIAAESLLFTVVLVFFSKGQRLKYAVKGISAIPYRYTMMSIEIFVWTRFLIDLAAGRQHRWRM